MLPRSLNNAREPNYRNGRITCEYGSIHKGYAHLGGGREGGREGASSNADKIGQGVGKDLAVSGHIFKFGVRKKEEGV